MTDDLLPVGATIGRYTVEGLLGQGGMAAVYKVRHEQLHTLHALKMLTVPGRRIRQRLVQEGRVQAALRHPNIVSVIDIIEHENQPGLVMEYVDGPTLEQLLADRKLAWHEIDHLGRGMLRGVQAAHAQGLIHRDLKPANVLIAVEDEQLVPKVTDFGLAKLQRSQTSGHTRSGDTMGTPAYMAPEAIKNAKHVDHRADVFSLGALLYELITCERCFQGGDILETFTAVVHAQHVPLIELRPDVPQRMIDAIEGALRPDPDDRLGSVQEVLQAWTEHASSDPGVTLTPAFTPGVLTRVRGMGQGRESLSKILAEHPTLPIPSDEGADPWTVRDQPSDSVDITETYLPLDDAPAPEALDTVHLTEAPAPEVDRSAGGVPWLSFGLAVAGIASLLIGIGAVGAAGVVATRRADATEPVALPTAAQRPLIPEIQEQELPPPAAPDPEPPPSPPDQAKPAPVPTPDGGGDEASGSDEGPPVDAPGEGGEAGEAAAGDDEPAAEAPPTPEAPLGTQARVSVDGGVRVELRPASGAGLRQPGLVPPGEYAVYAWFSGQPKLVFTRTFDAGQTYQVRCVKGLQTCK